VDINEYGVQDAIVMARRAAQQGAGRDNERGGAGHVVTKINLAEKFDRFTDLWSPKIVADLNDSHVKLAKVQGEFLWHRHEEEDELFIVVRGELTIQLRDGQVTLAPGELVVIPKGVEHRPVAQEEVHLMLIEPKGIRHTGDVVSERTVHEYARI
jgi:mannose-6-phosphate isomerase-like protein (cupin superfamily)